LPQFAQPNDSQGAQQGEAAPCLTTQSFVFAALVKFGKMQWLAVALPETTIL